MSGWRLWLALMCPDWDDGRWVALVWKLHPAPLGGRHTGAVIVADDGTAVWYA